MSTWVLLRGLAREARHWGGFRGRLAHHVRGELVVAVDLPGNGLRWRDASPTRLAAAMELVRSELAAAGHRPPYRLVALSLGAMAAVQWASAHPREVGGSVLINTSFGRFSPPWRRLRPAAMAQLGGLLLRGAPALERESCILRITSNFPVDAAVARAWADHAITSPVSRVNMLRQVMAAASFRAPAQAPAVPLLLLASRRDRLVSVECSRAIARAWQVKLEVHPDAGHDLPLDDPGWVIERILGWRAAHLF